MIINIVDDRKNKFLWKSIYGVVEPTYNDNSCKNSDKAVVDKSRISFIEWTKNPMSFSDILEWASQYEGENTLYVRDSDPMANHSRLNGTKI